MHGFAPDADVSFLVGEELTQVCVGRNETELALMGGILLSTTRRVTVNRGHVSVTTDNPRILAVALYDFLAETVEGVAWHQNGTLTLTFAGGGTITVGNDGASHHERYRIHRGKDVIVV